MTLLILLALALCGCALNGEDSGAREAGGYGGFVFTAEYGGKRTDICVDAPSAPVLAALGEPRSCFEEASCAFEGKDKHYDYGSFEILTRPGAEGDLIEAVYLMDDLAATREGLRIGDTEEDMLRIYGGDYVAYGDRRTYGRGGMTLDIILRDGRVVLITYSSALFGSAPE